MESADITKLFKGPIKNAPLMKSLLVNKKVISTDHIEALKSIFEMANNNQSIADIIINSESRLTGDTTIETLNSVLDIFLSKLSPHEAVPVVEMDGEFSDIENEYIQDILMDALEQDPTLINEINDKIIPMIIDMQNNDADTLDLFGDYASIADYYRDAYQQQQQQQQQDDDKAVPDAKSKKQQAEAEARAKKQQAEAEAKAKKQQAEAEARVQKQQAAAEARAKKEKADAEAKAKVVLSKVNSDDVSDSDKSIRSIKVKVKVPEKVGALGVNTIIYRKDGKLSEERYNSVELSVAIVNAKLLIVDVSTCSEKLFPVVLHLSGTATKLDIIKYIDRVLFKIEGEYKCVRSQPFEIVEYSEHSRYIYLRVKPYNKVITS